MYKFSSYGPIVAESEYHVPRTELIDAAYNQLMGNDPMKQGHYITIWAPRQAGKTWIMHNVLWRLQKDDRFDVLKINLEHLKLTTDENQVFQSIAKEIIRNLGLENVKVNNLDDFYTVFRRGVLQKPLILIFDEFDSLTEKAIGGIVSMFRNIYVKIREQAHLPMKEREYLLHNVALIGVHAVLGISNESGSPFNVQRGVHIPNLTFAEVESMFHWYERESGQSIEPEVISRIFTETRGQPGLVSWFGELLTETYNDTPDVPINMKNFEDMLLLAIHALPNSSVLNIISKIKQEPYQSFVLKLFKTGETAVFQYDNPEMNFLYLNGVIDWERQSNKQLILRFASPFIQKRIFNYFSATLFHDQGILYDPFDDLEDTITDDMLYIPNLIRRYELYLQKNAYWLLKNVPRRTDLRVYEAVYHFSLYTYIFQFLRSRGGQVIPEFPTGNGKIDLIIRYAGKVYGLELKSYVDAYESRKAMSQAAKYGKQLGLDEISLIFFVETIDDANREKLEVVHLDEETAVSVSPIFAATGNSMLQP